jgi:hypothetical protein
MTDVQKRSRDNSPQRKYRPFSLLPPKFGENVQEEVRKIQGLLLEQESFKYMSEIEDIEQGHESRAMIRDKVLADQIQEETRKLGARISELKQQAAIAAELEEKTCLERSTACKNLKEVCDHYIRTLAKDKHSLTQSSSSPDRNEVPTPGPIPDDNVLLVDVDKLQNSPHSSPVRSNTREERQTSSPPRPQPASPPPRQEPSLFTLASVCAAKRPAQTPRKRTKAMIPTAPVYENIF